MIFIRSERFKRAFQSLPKEIQKRVVRSLRLMAEDMFYPSLVVKKKFRVIQACGRRVWILNTA